MKPRLWPILLASALGLALLLTLGVWQVQRLHWKEGLIADLTARVKSPPITLAAAAERIAAGEDLEFTPVEATGRLRHDRELRVIATMDGGPAWEIVTPLETPEGQMVLVNRGLAPDQALSQLQRPDGAVTITGLVRQRPRSKGFFDPPNDVADNRWYWWDVPAMIAAADSGPGLRAAPFVLEESPVGPQLAFPRPLPTEISLRNNHLGYAITWFGLAAVLVVMAGLFVRQRMKESQAP